MQEFARFSDDELLMLSRNAQAEIQRRRKAKDDMEAKLCADCLARFPEAQIGCETKIVHMSTVNKSIHFQCVVARSPYFLCMLIMEKNHFEFRVELSPGNSQRWYTQNFVLCCSDLKRSLGTPLCLKGSS